MTATSADGFEAARDSVVAATRALLNDARPMLTAYYVSVGGMGSQGVFDAAGARVPDGRKAPAPLGRWFRTHEDPARGLVLWFTLEVTADGAELRSSSEEFPPPAVVSVARETGLVCEESILWFLQARSFDHRPESSLPQWWKEKCRKVGGWDDETDSLAVDEHGDPRFGHPILDPSDDGA